MTAPPCYIHRYRLTLRNGPANARSTRHEVEGFLIRQGHGFGCVHPWPELGDPTVPELLRLLENQQSHPLLQRALYCAARDGTAREQGRSLFTSPDIPLSHATITAPASADFPALRAAGFTAVKLKAHGQDPAIIPHIHAAIAAGLRVRLDCNGTGIAALRPLRELAPHIDFIEDPEPYSPNRWHEIRQELNIPLALDRLEGPDEAGYDIRILKPALDSPDPAPAVPVVFTSYMDHPVGQMFAALEASIYQGPQLQAGLLTHLLFENDDPFIAQVRSEGPKLLPPNGTGLGFDVLLESLPWQVTQASGLPYRSASGLPHHPKPPPTRQLLTNPRVPLPNAPSPSQIPPATLLFATSGSTGTPSLICLPESAMQANAAAVNAWISATSTDIWLRILPAFHVGGMSIHYRAALTGSRVIVHESKWNPAEFVSILTKNQVTLTSLVPAQVYDLVTQNLSPPPSLRIVFAGGGRLEETLYLKARALGWPILPCFGMTEASSQVAIARPETLLGPPPPHAPPLELLPCWEARVDQESRLQLRGPALLAGWMVRENNTWHLRPATDPTGWFTTADRVHLSHRILTPLGRGGRTVKILGELVDLDTLETAALAAGLPPDRGIIIALPDPRAGVRPWLITDYAPAESIIAAANDRLPPFARIAGFRHRELPRSPLGKVLRARVTEEEEAPSPRGCLTPPPLYAP